MELARILLPEGTSLTDRHEALINSFLVRSEWEVVPIPRSPLQQGQINDVLQRFRPPTAIIFTGDDPLLLAQFCRRTDQPVFLICPDSSGELHLHMV